MRAVKTPSLLGGFHPVAKGDLIFLPARPAQTDPRIWTHTHGKQNREQKEKATKSDPLNFWAGRFIVANVDGDGATITSPQVSRGVPQAPMPPRTDKSTLTHRVEALSLPPDSAHSATLRSQILHVRPFGGGPWLCPGRNLSMYEIIVALAVLVCRFDMRVDENALSMRGRPSPDLSRVGGMDPDRPFFVVVKPRS